MQHDETQFDAPRVVPVFPLPNTVFFPRTSLPLHIFEPRYRTMVIDAVSGDGLIAVALMEDDQFQPIGTVGRIRDLEPLEDGRFNMRLEGLQRVRMAEVQAETPYRQVEAIPIPEDPAENDAAAHQSKLDLLALIGVLRSVAQPQGQAIVLHEELPYEVVVNTTCSGLPIEADLRQALLEEDSLDHRRHLLTEHLNVVVEAISQLAAKEGSQDGILLN